MKKIPHNDLSYLWTAEHANKCALFGMWHNQHFANEEPIVCTVPDVNTAREYAQARHIRECYYGGTPRLLDRRYTPEEAGEYAQKEEKFEKMHLDMRDQIFTDNCGKKGLRDVFGNVLVDPQFDDFPELYTCFKRTILIPVIQNGRYFLYDFKEHQLLTQGYDRIFRYFWSYVDYFVAEEKGRKGILDSYDGTESTPIIMDEVYEMQDPDGPVPFEKDGKIGFLWCRTYSPPIFDRALICSEDYTRVQLNGKWGWIDHDGKFTEKKKDASFGSWYDLEK